MHLNGIDGMRYLGADPRHPADPIERLVSIALHNRIESEIAREQKKTRA